MRISLILLLFVFTNTSNVFAQQFIKVGDQAPNIYITNWIENVPEDKSLRDRIIVLEFWATWCGPCIAAVPHMNELQKNYNNDEILFISLTYENVEKVKRTLARVNFKSSVATDTTRTTQIQFGDGESGIGSYPITFVIDNENRIQWIGSPSSLSKVVLDKILNNSIIPSSRVESDQMKSNSSLSNVKNKMVDILKDEREYIFEMHQSTGSITSKSMINDELLLLNSYTILEIYEEIYSINSSHVSGPSEILNQKFDIVYKNKDKSFVHLESKLLEYLSLEKTVKYMQRKQFIFEIVSTDKLELNNDSPFTAKSDAGEKVVFTAYTLDALAKQLSSISEHQYQFKAIDKNKYDFIIDIKSEEAIMKSLNSYGITLIESEVEQSQIVLRIKS